MAKFRFTIARQAADNSGLDTPEQKTDVFQDIANAWARTMTHDGWVLRDVKVGKEPSQWLLFARLVAYTDSDRTYQVTLGPHSADVTIPRRPLMQRAAQMDYGTDHPETEALLALLQGAYDAALCGSA